MMLHRASLSVWSCFYLLGSVRSSSETSIPTLALPQHSCGGVPGELQPATVLADQGSLLLQSQVRKPQDVADSVSEEVRQELIGPLGQHQSEQLDSDLPKVALISSESGNQSSSQPLRSTLPGTRISGGITPNGQLAQVDSTVRPQHELNSSFDRPANSISDADPKEEELVQTQHVVESPEAKNLPWTRKEQLVDLMQTAMLQKSQGLAEGVLLFMLANILLCAIVSGICFIVNGRHGDSEEGDSWVEKDAIKNGRRPPNGTAQSRGIGALEERRSHAMMQKQAPSARSSGGNGNGGQRTPQRVPNSPGRFRPGESQANSVVNTPSGPARQLCPELVVPLGSECILAVRCLVSSQTQQCEFDVLDINGKAVLKVEVAPPSRVSRASHGPTQRSSTITLKALQPRETTGGMVLAYCCNVAKAEGDWNSNVNKRNVCIYNESDELFAHVVKDEARHRYVLTSGRPGLQLLFEGNFEERAVDVANEARELLAATEPSAMPFDPHNKYYKLRVAADVDVGLVLCGLLAIDQIEVK